MPADEPEAAPTVPGDPVPAAAVEEVDGDPRGASGDEVVPVGIRVRATPLRGGRDFRSET